jgi:tape measure domain-containing protein
MARRIVAEFDAVTGPFTAKLARIDKSINRFERGTMNSFGRVEKGVDGIVASARRLRAMTGIFGAGYGLKIATGFVDQSKLIRNALREAGDESEETYKRVFQASVRSLSGFQEFTVGVQRFQKSLGESQGIEASIRQMETLSKLLALSGKTQQERASTMLQFSQALQAGVLGGEELRAIRENAPIELTKAIARAAGGTIKDLKNLAKEGKLTTEVMVTALKVLEEEADRRFENIEVTIQDAAKVFQSGAIVAAEGFDEGLGLSKATVSGMKVVGEILGENADAAESFGKAVKVAGAFLAVSFAGRKISGFQRSMQSLSQARLADVAAVKEQIAADRAKVASARLSLDAANRRQRADYENARSSAAISRANAAQARAANTLSAAEGRLAATSATLAVAQARLSLSNRALAASGRLLKGAFAFLGGWPGLILTAATAFTLLRDKTEDTTDRLAELSDMSGDWKGSMNTLIDLQREYAEAIKATGQAAEDASGRVVEARAREVKTAKKALRDELTELQSKQRERLVLLPNLSEDLDKAGEELTKFEALVQTIRPGSNTKAIVRERREIIAAYLEAERAYDKLFSAKEEAARRIQEIQMTFFGSDFVEPNKSVLKAYDFVQKFLSDNEPKLEKQKALLESVTAARTKLLEEYKETDPIIVRLDAAMARLSSQMRKGKSDTEGLTEAAKNLRKALAGIASINLGIDDRMAVVAAKLRALRAGASQSEISATGFAQGEAIKLGRSGASLDAIAGKYESLLDKKKAELDLEKQYNEEFSKRFSQSVGSGGGGGGGSSNSDLQDALSYIESMATAQEKQAREIRKIVELRQRLVNITGIDLRLIDQLDVAIQRARENFDELSQAETEFWDSMSDNIASSIEDWKGWGSLVRSILADVVRQNGPDFLMALFNPSLRGGESFGSRAANWITSGVFHDGTTNAGLNGKTRQVPASTFVNAPRFHNGALRVGEIPAILERGETVLPKNLSLDRLGGSSFTLQADFRGADSGAIPRIQAQLDKFSAEFGPRVIATMTKAGKSRVKI